MPIQSLDIYGPISFVTPLHTALHSMAGGKPSFRHVSFFILPNVAVFKSGGVLPTYRAILLSDFL